MPLVSPDVAKNSIPGGETAKVVGIKGSSPIVLLSGAARRPFPSSDSLDHFSSAVTGPNNNPVHSPGPEALSDTVTSADSHSSADSSLRTVPPSIPRVRFDDLCLQHVVGGGSFGQVWQGTWMGTPVAIKMIPQSPGPRSPSEEAAFEAEVSLLGRLRHPHICLILGACLEPQHRAIVTELLSRGSLWDALRRRDLFKAGPSSGPPGLPAPNSSWPSWAMRRVLEGACRALAYLHGHCPPIVHRDLKSPNLLLDDSLHVKVCDFGLARLRDRDRAMTANVGTLQWMAPEVISGQRYSEAADIYSLGIIMWELFTGECPYDHLSHIELAAAVSQRQERPHIPAGCSPAQAQLMQRCWSANPSHRQSAIDLLSSISSCYP